MNRYTPSIFFGNPIFRQTQVVLIPKSEILLVMKHGEIWKRLHLRWDFPISPISSYFSVAMLSQREWTRPAFLGLPLRRDRLKFRLRPQSLAAGDRRAVRLSRKIPRWMLISPSDPFVDMEFLDKSRESMGILIILITVLLSSFFVHTYIHCTGFWVWDEIR